jgi:hypothetical protein
MTTPLVDRGDRRTLAIAAGAVVVGAAIGALGWTRMRDEWFYAYLVAWLFWAGLSLGSLSLLLLHNLTGGRWGRAARPQLHAAASLLPLMAMLFVPIALEPARLYEWADPSHVEHDEILQHKAKYLNVESFQIRAAVYLTIWLALLALLAWQARATPVAETPADRRFRRFSGQGLGLHGLAVTFASIDWMMSLEPHWFSTIYGVLVFCAQGLAALALAIVGIKAASVVTVRDEAHAAAVASHAAPPAPSGVVDADALHDLGKLLLGFTMLWAYLAFSQFFIIWYGNVPEEVVWYQARFAGAWGGVALALALFHFVAPFAMLLSRELKRDPVRLGGVAAMLVVMFWVEMLWMIQPAVHRPENTLYVPWLDLGLTLALGGAWWFGYAWLRPRYEGAWRLPSMPLTEAPHG